LSNVDLYLHGNPWLAFAAVFLGGLLTATNPCVLAMIPLMMSYVAGRREEGASPLRALGFSFVFVLGLSVTFTVLGLLASLAGTAYEGVSPVWSWIVAAVCLLMGLHLMGVVHVPIPAPSVLPRRMRGLLGAFVLGLLFGIVSAPCAAPILVVLLVYLSGSDASPAYGALLLLTYGLGHSVLILIAGTSVGFVRKLLASGGVSRTFDILRRLAGVAIVLVGVWFAIGALGDKGAVSAEGPTEAVSSEMSDGAVARVVFVGQEEACECTHERIEASWMALLEALGSDALPVERLDLDTQAGEVEPYRKMKPIVVVPALYFLDAGGGLIAQLQGQVSVDKVRSLLVAK